MLSVCIKKQDESLVKTQHKSTTVVVSQSTDVHSSTCHTHTHAQAHAHTPFNGPLSRTEWWGAGVVICLERGADLHMAQLMPLPLTVVPGSPGQRVVKRVCVCSAVKLTAGRENDEM